MTTRAYSFTVDEEADAFVENILRRLQNRYGLGASEALGRLQELWGNAKIGGPREIIFCDDPDTWAARFFFAREEPEPVFHDPTTRPHVNDLVRVRAVRQTPRHVALGDPRVGDLATVRNVLPGLGEAVFVVDGTDDDRQLRWEADFFQDELEIINPWTVDK